MVLNAAPAAAADRIRVRAGPDRFATLIDAGEARFPTTAVVVGAAPAPDVAAGAALAATTGAMFLLASPGGLRFDVVEHLRTHVRQGATVYVVGGAVAVAPAAERQLRDRGYVVRRVAGADRYDTAARLADLTIPDARRVIISSQADPALPCAAAAAGLGFALVLTDGERLPSATAAFLEQHQPREIIAINDAAAAVDETRAIRGAGTAATCAAIAEALYDHPSPVSLAGSTRPADGFIAAAYTEAAAPLLLVDDQRPSIVMDYLRLHAEDLTTGVAYGGTAGLSRRSIQEAEAALNGCPPGFPDERQPFGPFEVNVTTDTTTYRHRQPVRIVVNVCNRGSSDYTQQHPLPLLRVTIVNDHGSEAATEPDRVYPAVMDSTTWAAGECTTEWAANWDQHTGATLTSAAHDDGPLAPSGSYRISAAWSGSDGDPCHGYGATFHSESFDIS